MKIYFLDFTIHRGGYLIVDKDDEVLNCAIHIPKDEGMGMAYPIVIFDGATFRENQVLSERPDPILVKDHYGTHNFTQFTRNHIAAPEDSPKQVVARK